MEPPTWAQLCCSITYPTLDTSPESAIIFLSHRPNKQTAAAAHTHRRCKPRPGLLDGACACLSSSAHAWGADVTIASVAQREDRC